MDHRYSRSFIRWFQGFKLFRLPQFSGSDAAPSAAGSRTGPNSGPSAYAGSSSSAYDAGSSSSAYDAGSSSSSVADTGPSTRTGPGHGTRIIRSDHFLRCIQWRFPDFTDTFGRKPGTA
jgi:hypothetical protein